MSNSKRQFLRIAFTHLSTNNTINSNVPGFEYSTVYPDDKYVEEFFNFFFNFNFNFVTSFRNWWSHVDDPAVLSTVLWTSITSNDLFKTHLLVLTILQRVRTIRVRKLNFPNINFVQQRIIALVTTHTLCSISYVLSHISYMNL